MAYNQFNFITPLTSTDKILKINNDKGSIMFLIRESTSTVKHIGNLVYLKQSGDANVIILDFSEESEAYNASNLLRTALDKLSKNLNINQSGNSGSGWNNYNSDNTTATGGGVVGGTSQFSLDVKNEYCLNTLHNGDNTGITTLLDNPKGIVSVFLNGLEVIVGNNCTPTTFLSPLWNCLFAKNYTLSSNTTTDITLINSTGLINGDVLIVKNSLGNNYCFIIASISGNIVTITGSIIGTLTKVYKTKAYNKIEQGDELLWFGSYEGFQLDTTDKISLIYIK